MSEKTTVSIGKYEIPKQLFDDYIKFKIMADSYLSGTGENPSNTDFERSMRWNLCVQQVMKIHRKICQAIGVEYSEDYHDEFYTAFHKEMNKRTRLKG
jgi:hypothetical protein